MNTHPLGHTKHAHGGLRVEAYVIFILQIIVILCALLLIGACTVIA